MRRSLGCKSIFFLILVLNASRLVAFETLEENSFGSDATNAEKSGQISAVASSHLVDGEITSYPPDAATFDRYLVSQLRIWFGGGVAQNFSYRMILDSKYTIRKSYEEDEPRTIVEHEWHDFMPRLDLGYKTLGGLDLVGAVAYRYIPESEKLSTSISFEETSTYEAAGYPLYSVGVMKNSSSLSAGVFYLAGNSQDRSITKEASDGSLVETSDVLYHPPEVSLFIRTVIKGYQTDMEFSFVQASGEGEKTQDNGNSMVEDYMRVYLGIVIPWERSSQNFHVSLKHKTLSYADSAFMSIETIPMTTLQIKYINGSLDKHLFLGLAYSYAKDTQSLPEFNQRYLVNAYGASLGFNYSF